MNDRCAATVNSRKQRRRTWQPTSNREGHEELSMFQSGGIVKETGSAVVRDCGYIIPARGSEAIMVPAQNRSRGYERHIR